MLIRNVQNGDIRTSGVQFVTDTEAIAQGVRARLRMFLGESFIDITKGTPWFQAILGKTPQDIAEVNIKDRVLSSPGVAQIRRFRFEPDLGRRTILLEMVLVGTTGEEFSVNINEAIV